MAGHFKTLIIQFMSTKQKCKGYCMEFLQSRNLAHIFDQKEFERIYRGKSQLNPVSVALNIMDSLIFSYHQKLVTNESRNEA
jgi:hypothetical protein